MLVTYDDASRKTSETTTYPAGYSLKYSYTYSLAGKKTQLIWPDTTAIGYSYSQHGQLESVSIPGKGNISVAQFKWLEPAQVTLPGGTAQDRTLDGLLNLESLKVKTPGQQTVLSLANAYGKVQELKTSYHAHLARHTSGAQQRYVSDEALLVHIKAVHAETRSAYGWPRIWHSLVTRGIAVGKQRVQKLMQLNGIRAKGKRRFKVTTDSNHKLPISPNLLNREFSVAEPDKAWVGDITYIATDEGWLYLAVVIDLFSRQVVGWSLRDDMTSNIVMDALRMAWFRRHPGKHAGVLFHSDRGSQYASSAFREVLKQYGVTSSMSRRGNCWDNACSEALFGSLKVERLHGQRFVTRRHAKDETIAWLLWYNKARLHSTLAYVSPMQFEQTWLAAQARQASS